MNKRAHVLFFLILASQLLIGCKEEKQPMHSLTGTWIALESKMDTIDFSSINNQMILRRGYELVEGQKLPKNGSGIYSLKIKPDSIAINNLFWNCVCYYTYYFKVNATYDTLQIGNFYDSEKSSNTRITFYRRNPSAEFIPL